MPKLAACVSLTEYSQDFDIPVAFPPTSLRHVLGEYLSDLGLRQLRLAETEKYAHVTFFFNGGREEPFDGEERILVPSPKVATYDLQPEMSAPEVTDNLVKAIDSNNYDVIICNFANPDMVGHTGKYAAAVAAIEAIDCCLGRILEAIEKSEMELLITADHGNAEQMVDRETGQAHTAHTSNPVPLIYVGRPAQLQERGALCDIAPTILQIMGLEQPIEMSGRPLIYFVNAVA
jgi:2,3-bisphosphoglycerate-independent phosphoglycerate mutase